MWLPVITQPVDKSHHARDWQSDGNKIGLFGGTFDPVHFGHLRPAIELAEHYELSTLHLLPNHRQVHRGPARATTTQRINMLEIATQGSHLLTVDTREALRDSASYTYHTLQDVSTTFDDATLIFFMGIDAFALFDTWYNWEGILELANLVIISRPDARHSEFSSELVQRQKNRLGQQIETGKTGVIEQIDVTQMAISATDVRRRIGLGQNVQFLLPEGVREYIDKERLYIAESATT